MYAVDDGKTIAKWNLVCIAVYGIFLSKTKVSLTIIFKTKSKSVLATEFKKKKSTEMYSMTLGAFTI